MESVGNMLPSLPMTTITGYLGAGKTTLINRILSEAAGQRITVLVNDFGEIAIDERLIVNQTGDKIVLANGCVCCSIGGALYAAIDDILSADNRPDHLIIETSGVADPGKVVDIAAAEPELTRAQVLTLIDCAGFERNMANPMLRDTLERQAVCADTVILSKLDVMHEQGRSFNNALSELARATTGANVIDSRELIATNGNWVKNILAPPQSGHRQTDVSVRSAVRASLRRDAVQHDVMWRHWSYVGLSTIDIADLEAASQPDVSGVERLKGFVAAPSGETFEVHRVGDIWSSRKVDSEINGRVSSIVAIGLRSALDCAHLDRVCGV